MRISIYPFVSPERQISLVYNLDRRARVKTITFDKPLCAAFSVFENEHGRLPRQNEADALAQVQSVDMQIDPALAKQWMTRFWNEVSEAARTAPAAALKGDKEGEETITLDPNTYEFRFKDEDKTFRLSFAGPDPERVRGLDGLDPLVRLANDMSLQCQALQKKPTR